MKKENKVNYGVAGLEDIVADVTGNNGQGGAIAVPGEKRSVGRPKVHENSTERTSISLDSEVMGKLRMLALLSGKQLSNVIEEALVKHFSAYEKKNGEIPVPDIYRKK